MLSLCDVYSFDCHVKQSRTFPEGHEISHSILKITSVELRVLLRYLLELFCIANYPV